MSLKSTLKTWLRIRVAPKLAYWFYRSLSATWKITLDESEFVRKALAERRPLIFAHWHGDELAMIQMARTRQRRLGGMALRPIASVQQDRALEETSKRERCSVSCDTTRKGA